MSTTESLLRAGRPTISVHGDDRLTGGLLYMQIAETTSGLYRCEAKFGNWGTVRGAIGFLYFDRSFVDFGSDFKVNFEDQTLFSGKIMGLEAGFPETRSPEITILAEDSLQDFRMTRRTRTFTDVSDSDIMEQIASDHRLAPNVSVNGPQYRVVAQVNQSDLAFLRERARAVDAELWIEDGQLNASARSSRNAGSVTLTYGHELYEMYILADLAGQRTSIAVTGWDVSGKTAIRYDADDSAIAPEVGSGTSGARILASLGDRKDCYAHTVPLTSGEAQAEAEAFFRMSARRFLIGRGVTQSTNLVRVGTHVDLQGLGPLFSGQYYVTEVRHLFDGIRGIRTDFTVERPGLGTPQ